MFYFLYLQMSAHTKVRSRLSSIGDSVPPSDSSEGSGSESFENVPDWTMDKSPSTPDALFISSNSDMNHHSLSPDNSGVLTDNERAQVESFFSGLGTEVIAIFYYFQMMKCWNIESCTLNVLWVCLQNSYVVEMTSLTKVTNLNQFIVLLRKTTCRL